MREEIYNIRLIRDNCKHIQFELNDTSPFFFRISKEAHHAMYRSMIEALKGTSNLQVTYDRSKKRKHIHKYKRNGEPWYEIRKINIPECKLAWRFSQPHKCEEPIITKSIDWDDIAKQDFLIGFFEALAMIQSDCFMRKYIESKPVTVSDSEMVNLEWLHNVIRNTFEHFIPTNLIAAKADLIESSIICIRLTKALLFESHNIIFHYPVYNLLKQLDSIIEMINTFTIKDEV